MSIPSFTIKTLGCKVNQYESQAIRENLVSLGFAEAGPGPADLVVVNSCTVTGQADVKTRRLIRRSKRENPHATLVVTGCKAEFDDDVKSLLDMPEVDQVVINSEKMQLPLFMSSYYGLECTNSGLKEKVSGFDSHTRAFLKIQDGCDQRCSYCKVSLVRGHSKSRDREGITEELCRFVEHGYREIVLTGICIGSWKGEGGSGLPELVREIDGIKGDFRVRISSIEPNHITDDLIKAVAGSDRICRHFHIPLQSGSDRILALMGRKYDTAYFRDLTHRIRAAMPLAGITMDVIAGFPGESEEDFRMTLGLIEELKPSRLHVFKYSDRKGTLSSGMKGKIPAGVVSSRVTDLIKAGKRSQNGFCRRFLSKEVEVLVEKKTGDGFHEGYTGEYVRVRLWGPSLREGGLVRLKADRADGNATLVFENKELAKI